MSEDDSRVASALCPRVHGWPTRVGLQNCGNMASPIMSGGSSSLFSGLNDKDAQRAEMDGASARPGLGLCPTRPRPCWVRGRPLLPPPHSTPWRFARLGPKVSAVASPQGSEPRRRPHVLRAACSRGEEALLASHALQERGLCPQPGTPPASLLPLLPKRPSHVLRRWERPLHLVHVPRSQPPQTLCGSRWLAGSMSDFLGHSASPVDQG